MFLGNVQPQSRNQTISRQVIGKRMHFLHGGRFARTLDFVHGDLDGYPHRNGKNIREVLECNTIAPYQNQREVQLWNVFVRFV